MPSSPAAAGGGAAGDGPQDMETETAAGGGSGGAGDVAPLSEAEALRLCSLYCALCIKRHRLLRGLLLTYGKAGAPAR